MNTVTTPCKTLTAQELQHFLEFGFVHLKGCFPREKAKELTDLAFQRIGYDPADPSTWVEEKIHLPVMNHQDVATFAPRAYAAICDLLGGEDRFKKPVTWGDGFIINFKYLATQGWKAPCADSPGWHKDGDFFRHFLDSPEQGLLTLICWSDIGPRGGGTFFAPDSIGHVARDLVQHPEGQVPGQMNHRANIQRCRDFREATGETGDVILLHPYMLHASSPNVSGIPRFLTNPPVQLIEPMNFNRARADAFSPVERVVLNALNVERLDFRITGERERIEPERVRRQRAMLEEEKKRLAALRK